MYLRGKKQRKLISITDSSKALLAIYSDPANLSTEAKTQLADIADQLDGISQRLDAGHDGLVPTQEALDQPPWGVTEDEIPILPTTPRGVLFDVVSADAPPLPKIMPLCAICQQMPQASLKK